MHLNTKINTNFVRSNHRKAIHIMTYKKQGWISMLSGTLSLMFCWFFWMPYYGIGVTVLTMVLAAIAFISGRRLRKQYNRNPETISEDSQRNARYGVVMGIIGFIMSFICFVFALIITIFFTFLI